VEFGGGNKLSLVSIAIDGPSGAGKSTLARQCAQQMGYIYVDTGAIYRTVALYCHQNGISSEDAAAVERALPEIRIDLTYDETGTQRMMLNGADVSDQIRTPEISMFTSAISAIPAVRAFLLEKQRELARTHSVVMDGRDIGTVVLPDATVKVYLTAAPEARAQRRCTELRAKGMDVSFDEILKDVQERDYNDAHRAVSPLKQADDAKLLDTTCLDLEQSLNVLVQIVQEGIARG
jgi:CMP/dCMP kinase